MNERECQCNLIEGYGIDGKCAFCVGRLLKKQIDKLDNLLKKGDK